MFSRLRNTFTSLPKPELNSGVTLRSSTGWMFGANLVAIVALTVQAIFLSRILGPQLLGSYLLIISSIELLQEILNLNVDAFVIRWVTLARENSDVKSEAATLLLGYFVAGLSSSIGCSLVCVGSLIFSFSLTDSGVALWVVAIFSVARSCSIIDLVGLSYMRTLGRFKGNSLTRIISVLVETSIIVSSAVLFGDVQSVLLAGTVAFLLGSVIRTAYVIPVIGELLQRANFTSFSQVARQLHPILPGLRVFVWNNSLARTIKTVMTRADLLIVGFFVGSGAVGIYSVVKKIALSPSVFVDPLSNTLYPRFVELFAQENFSELKRLIRRTHLALVGILTIGFIAFLLFGREVVAFVFGSTFSSAYSGSVVGLGSSVIAYSFFWLSPLLLAIGDSRARLRFDSITLLIWFSLTFPLTSMFGIEGCACAGLIATAFSVTVQARYIRRFLDNLQSKVKSQFTRTVTRNVDSKVEVSL